MRPHPHEHESEEQAQTCTCCHPEPTTGFRIVAGSVIIGSIIVALAVVLSMAKLGKEMDGQSVMVKGSDSAAPAQPAQAAAGTAPTPGAPVSIIDRTGAAVMGNANAPVTIYEFSDFQCPFCTQFFKQTLSDIRKNYVDTGKVKIIYRNYPLPFHQNAQIAAQAGECANIQGKFEAYHDIMFTNSQADGTGLNIPDLKKYAATIGLNTTKFNQCLDKNETAPAVAEDMKDATAAGVTGTPTFYIDGVQLVGAQPFSTFQSAIDAALAKK